MEAEQFRTLAAIRDFLAALVEGGGVVLVIDDLHWVDSSTEAVLGDLLVRRPIDGLTVVATYRDTEPTSLWMRTRWSIWEGWTRHEPGST